MHGGVAILPLSTAVFYSRDDLVHVHRRTPLIAEFARMVTEIARQA